MKTGNGVAVSLRTPLCLTGQGVGMPAKANPSAVRSLMEAHQKQADTADNKVWGKQFKKGSSQHDRRRMKSMGVAVKPFTPAPRVTGKERRGSNNDATSEPSLDDTGYTPTHDHTVTDKQSTQDELTFHLPPLHFR